MAKSNKVTKAQNMYQNLQERYEEMDDYLSNLIDDHRRCEEDLRYISDFIHCKNLDDEFRYFKEHAHEDKDSELPFPRLVL